MRSPLNTMTANNAAKLQKIQLIEHKRQNLSPVSLKKCQKEKSISRCQLSGVSSCLRSKSSRMLSLTNKEFPKIRMTSKTGLPNWRSKNNIILIMFGKKMAVSEIYSHKQAFLYLSKYKKVRTTDGVKVASFEATKIH